MEFESSSNATDATVVDEFQRANSTEELEFLQLRTVSAEETTIATSTSTSPTEDSDLELEPWIIVLIVSLIILLILVVIIAILAWKYRQEKKTDKEEIGLYGYLADNMKRANYTNAIYGNESGYANEGGYANGRHVSRGEEQVVNEAYL